MMEAISLPKGEKILKSSDRAVEERSKPFRLVKYFTVTSLTLIFLGTIILSMLNTHWARTMQREKSEEYALLIIENLNHQIFLQFIMPVVLRYGKIQLRNEEQYELMDKVVRNTLHSFKVETVNIYDMNNVISYSFKKELIGRTNLGGTGYQTAVDGNSVSRQVQRGNFLEILFGIPKESRFITYAPLRAEQLPSRISGPVLGVIEIVQDLSDEYKSIFKYQVYVVTTSALVMLVLFLVLIFVVKRGEGIIEQRAQERLRLKEQLNRAAHLSSLGEMAAVISHEIRNPLGIIRSSAELLKKKVTGFDPKNTIPDIVIEESSRLNNIITDFLKYARPRPPRLAPCRIEDVLEKNLTFLSTQLEGKGYSVQKTIGDNLPAVTADADMLYQAFLNIFINALQAMPDGGQIFLQVQAKPDVLEVIIADQGGGVPQEILVKVWDPFFTTKDKGTGLGLGIVKNIVDAHGGDILIENASDGGARLIIHLPLQQKG
jgi:two-component system sensor histidine kinase HydH